MRNQIRTTQRVTSPMKKLLLLAAISFAAPAYAGPYEQGYTAGALYGAACAVMQGRVSESQAGLAVAVTLRNKGISPSYASDPAAQKLAHLLYVRNGGCR